MDIINLLETAGITVRATGKSSEFIIQCPECQKWKLYINPETKNWICFRCDTGGTARSLFKLLHIDYQDQESSQLARLRAQGMQAPKRPEIIKTNHALPEEYRSLSENSEKGLFATICRNYLHKRNVTDAMIDRWKLGYCGTGRLVGHLIVPITDLAGGTISFQGRRLIGVGPKNHNPPGDAGLLFNLHNAKNYPGLVLVEGPFDAMAVHEKMADSCNVSSLALMGTGISEETAAIIGRIIKPEVVWVALDPDMEPIRSHKIGNVLTKNGVNEVKVALPSADPDELTYKELEGMLDEAEPLRKLNI